MAMMIPACQPGMNAQDGAAALERPIFDAQDMPPAAAPAAPMVATPALAYADFFAAVKDALRDIYSPDLLSRNPLLLHGICNLGKSAGPQELKALLCETVGTLFGNARDEKLRRVLELTYFQPALKQEVVAHRLSLSFGTYRRHLGTARDRLARWLWESSRVLQAQPELPSTPETPTKNGEVEGETAISHVTGEPTPPRLSLVVLPFMNIGGSAKDDHFVDGITETLTTDLARCSGVWAISRSTALAYKGKPIDTRQIGRELGVRYVLEGSVQNAGERTRFNAQLVDAESGAHLWAERFDKRRTDLLDMQDEVTTRLAHEVHIELIAAESRRAAREHPTDSTPSITLFTGGLPGTDIGRSRRRGKHVVFSKPRSASTSTTSTRFWALQTPICRKSTCTHPTIVPARSARPRQPRQRRWRWPRTTPMRM
jgi:TolB-like protein